MEPTNPSGSFGAATGGGGSAIAQAMQRRGMDPGILNQVTPSAPTFGERAPLPIIPQGTPQAIPPQRIQTPSGQNETAIGLPPSSAEAKVILSALSKRLDTIGELQKSGIG